jgi:hypothetical protein
LHLIGGPSRDGRFASPASRQAPLIRFGCQDEALLEVIVVNAVMPFRAKDQTNVERQRRYRAKRRAATATTPERNGVTVDAPPERNGVMIVTWEMCSLAARLTDGRATPDPSTT